MSLQIFVRFVYGRPLSYPANERGRQFASLIGVRTFTAMELEQIAALGEQIEVVADPAVAGRAAP